MNVSCEIIKDLLPLYHDGVCSNETKAIVEEHLTQCESCKAELAEMDDALSVSGIEQNMSEAEAVEKLSKRWKKGMIKSVLEGALFTLIAVIIILMVLFIFFGIRIG